MTALEAAFYDPGQGYDYPRELWRCLSASQVSSLKHVAYGMAEGDIIYVKEGPLIVGRGKVLGPYKFRLNPNILDSDHYLWPHQVPVAWESDFPSFNLKLGPELHTVLTLTPEYMSKLKVSMSISLAKEAEMDVLEGEMATCTTRFRQRNRTVIAAKKRLSDGKCEACGMRFAERYDMPPGKDCLHAHHKNPIAERNGATVTSLKDLVLVCPNCHAVIETFHPVLTIQQLKMKIR
jgi:predicted HNH restriction endonuclease